MVSFSVLFITFLLLILQVVWGCLVRVEKKEYTTLECTFKNKTENITWQFTDFIKFYNLTTCSLSSYNCSDPITNLLQGRVSSSTEAKTSSLDIFNVMLSWTYRCLYDDGSTEECDLDVQGFIVPVEKGANASLECPFKDNSDSLTWLLWYRGQFINVSVCSLSSNDCSDEYPTFFQGRVRNSGGARTSFLSVVNDTDFRCLYDDDNFIKYELAIYVWPSKPKCTTTLTENFLEINCTTVNVYPGISSTLHFTGKTQDFDNGSCALGDYGSGKFGDYSATCVHRTPMKNITPGKRIFYNEMKSFLANETQVNRAPARSDDFSVQIDAPKPLLVGCPTGGSVTDGIIKVGTNATCRCQVQQAVLVKGQARWFTENETVVGLEDERDYSSTLTVFSSMKGQSFTCRAISILGGEPQKETFKPEFSRGSNTVSMGLCPFIIGIAAFFDSVISPDI